MASRNPVWNTPSCVPALRMSGALVLMILLLAVAPAGAQPDTTATVEQDTTLIDTIDADTQLEPEAIQPDTTDEMGSEPLIDEAMEDTLGTDDGMMDPFEDAAMDADTTMMEADTSGMMDMDMMDAPADTMMMDSMDAPADSMMMDAAADTSMMMPDTTMMGSDTTGMDSMEFVDPFATDQPMAMGTVATPSIRIGPGPLPDPNRRFRGDAAGEGYTQGFRMDRTEVTNEQFARFLSGDSAGAMFFDERMYITKNEDGSFTADPGYENYPVVFVDWYGAYAYAQWAGKSLPTEEEWILAVLGSYSDQDLTMWYPWGQADSESIQANLLDINTIGAPDSVASYPTSDTPTGIADMAGNVAEWTLTNFVKQRAFGESTEGLNGQTMPPDSIAVNNTQVDSTLRFVIKGGSYLDPAINTQLNRRATRFPHERYQYVGFRCITREGTR